MNAALLVSYRDVGQLEVLLQGLADARDVAVAEDPQHAAEKPVFDAIAQLPSPPGPPEATAAAELTEAECA